MNFKQPTANSQLPTGFTLIETLVAIAILTISIAGPLYSAGRSLSAARNASNQLTASYLAQEGIEYVRMMRDNQYLIAYSENQTTASTLAWTRFKTGFINVNPYSMGPCKGTETTGFKCAVDARDSTSPENRLVQKTAATSITDPSFMVRLNNLPSIFYRSIQASDLSNEERITSTVTWSYHNTLYTVTVIDHLTPWQ